MCCVAACLLKVPHQLRIGLFMGPGQNIFLKADILFPIVVAPESSVFINIFFNTLVNLTQRTFGMDWRWILVCLFLCFCMIKPPYRMYLSVHSICVVLLLIQEDLRVSGWPSSLWRFTVAARTVRSGQTVISLQQSTHFLYGKQRCYTKACIW